jgi:tetratricopeptide (TPR) repeat protein
MFKSALEIAQVTQTSQASWATTWLNLGTSLRKLGQLNEARDAYLKVLEIDSRSAPALGFLGLVYHLMDQLDDAIVKYHEVRFLALLCKTHSGNANLAYCIPSRNNLAVFRISNLTRERHFDPFSISSHPSFGPCFPPK